MLLNFVLLIALRLFIHGVHSAETHLPTFPFSPGFDIEAVTAKAQALPSHSWEYGTAAEAMLELYSSAYSVFGLHPFPFTSDIDVTTIPALEYAKDKIPIGPNHDLDGISNGNGAAGDPASLGVSAYMLGLHNESLAAAVAVEVEYLLTRVPRFANGAISHRVSVAELWADFVYMAPPFLAYYGAATDNITLLDITVEQAGLYREILQAPEAGGIWHHIIGPQSQDLGLWSTGNAWAAAGMTRVLATVKKAPLSAPGAHIWKREAIAKLTQYIVEILDSAIASPTEPETGLLRNYLSDTLDDGHGYGEISGSSLLAATAYRMAVLVPEAVGKKYIDWADQVRAILGNGEHITSDGTVTPAVNPLNWFDTVPYTAGSPEGNNFVVLLYAAWRDCVFARICGRY